MLSAHCCAFQIRIVERYPAAQIKRRVRDEMANERQTAGITVSDWSARAPVCRATTTKLIFAHGSERLRSVLVRGRRLILETPEAYFARLEELQKGGAASNGAIREEAVGKNRPDTQQALSKNGSGSSDIEQPQTRRRRSTTVKAPK